MDDPVLLEVLERFQALEQRVLPRHTDARAGLRALLGVAATLSTPNLASLARASGLEKTRVTRDIAALEQLGWVSKSHDPTDRRSRLISITPLGAAELDATRSERAKLASVCLRQLAPADRAAAQRAFHRLARLLADEGPPRLGALRSKRAAIL